MDEPSWGIGSVVVTRLLNKEGDVRLVLVLWDRFNSFILVICEREEDHQKDGVIDHIEEWYNCTLLEAVQLTEDRQTWRETVDVITDSTAHMGYEHKKKTLVNIIFFISFLNKYYAVSVTVLA